MPTNVETYLPDASHIMHSRWKYFLCRASASKLLYFLGGQVTVKLGPSHCETGARLASSGDYLPLWHRRHGPRRRAPPGQRKKISSGILFYLPSGSWDAAAFFFSAGSPGEGGGVVVEGVAPRKEPQDAAVTRATINCLRNVNERGYSIASARFHRRDEGAIPQPPSRKGEDAMPELRQDPSSGHSRLEPQVPSAQAPPRGSRTATLGQTAGNGGSKFSAAHGQRARQRGARPE